MNQSYQNTLSLGQPGHAAQRATATSGRGLGWFLRLSSVWHDRWRQRQALAALDNRALVDLGLDRQQVLAEVEKPFWQP